MNSIQKTLIFLEMISKNPSGLRLPEIAPHLGISVPAVHSYAKSFIAEGYIVKDKDSGRFRPTFKIVKLGLTLLRQHPIIEITSPLLNKLNKEIHAPVHLAIKEQNLGLCINKAGTNQSQLSIHRVGSEFALYPTCLGRAILAFLPPEEQDKYFEAVQLEPFTKRTVTSIDEMKKILVKVKQQGYAVDFEEHKIGLCGMGVPIFDHQERVIGALSSVIPFTLTVEEEIHTAKILQNYAKSLSSPLEDIILIESL